MPADPSATANTATPANAPAATITAAPHPEQKDSRPWKLGFWSLIVTQFQNAFNDNALKFLVIYIIVAMNFTPSQRDRLVFIVSALFAVPFILFSMTGGPLLRLTPRRKPFGAGVKRQLGSGGRKTQGSSTFPLSGFVSKRFCDHISRQG